MLKNSGSVGQVKLEHRYYTRSRVLHLPNTIHYDLLSLWLKRSVQFMELEVY